METELIYKNVFQTANTSQLYIFDSYQSFFKQSSWDNKTIGTITAGNKHKNPKTSTFKFYLSPGKKARLLKQQCR